MFATKRRFEPSVVQRLLDEPYKFEFFQAVRLLEIWLKQNGVSQKSAVSDYLRFKNRITLSFPASELDALIPQPPTIGKTDAQVLAALRKGELNHISITPTFMGFLGGNGALPAHYTERIATHMLLERDDGPKAFLDTFSNRALALFYEAWRKYRLALKYEHSQEDRFLPLLLSLAGIGQPSLQNRLNAGGEGVLDQSIAYYAAAFRQRPVSAASMQKVLSAYFVAPIQIAQFIGGWYAVPQHQQTQLGGSSAVLGSGAMAGTRVWQRDLCMHLVIGPLAREMFDDFLPTKRAAKALKKMLTMFTGMSIEYEVRLVLRKEDVNGISLNANENVGRLGWNSFLMTEPATEDRQDVRYKIHAL